MRLRLRFSKLGPVRFTSHRDVARAWERALRRAALPVRYTQGFSPRPRLSFGLALPTGAESDGEYLDVELDADAAREWRGGLDPDELPGVLSPLLPVGLEVQAAAVADPSVPSLQEAVTSCGWVVHVGRVEDDGGVGACDEGAVAEAAAAALAAEQLVIVRQRKGKTREEDVRPAVRTLEVQGVADGAVVVRAELAAQPRALRPHELLDALDAGLVPVRLRRTHQWIERDGARWEPMLPADRSPRSPHAERRAS